MKLLTIFLFVMIAQVANAAGGYHDGIPWKTIGWQIFNLSILFSVMVYLLKKPAREYFSSRKQVFLFEKNKAQEAKEIAEKNLTDLKNKLETTKSTRSMTISRAQSEAADLKKKIKMSAELESQKIIQEAKQNATIEFMKVIRDLKIMTTKNVIATARSVARKDLGAEAHQKLHNRFVEQIGTDTI